MPWLWSRTVSDLMILREWSEKNDGRADINRDGRVDLFDHLEAIELGMRCL